MKLAFTAALRVALLTCAACLASPVQARDLPLKVYTSPSAQMTLTVDPGDRAGAGSAKYALRRDGRLVWEGNRSFTLWDAVVADDGSVAGYAYSNGYIPSYIDSPGEFIVAILDPEGAVRQTQKMPREPSRFLHAVDDPKAAGLFLDAENDRFVVRVVDADHNAMMESWWTYRISDGKPTGNYRPGQLMDDPTHVSHILVARPVPDTPLTLVQWLRHECVPPECLLKMGTRFTLVDLDYKPVWSLELAEDYTNRADEKSENRLLDEMREHGAILDTSQPARFALRHAASGLHVTYAVERHSGHDARWDVREIARAPFTRAVTTKTAQEAVTELVLHGLGSIEIGSRSVLDTSPIEDIDTFAVGEGGRFAFVTGCGCDKGREHALIIVDERGELIRKIALPGLLGTESFTDHLVWAGGDRWLLTISKSGSDAHASAMWIDGANGTIAPMKDFSAPAVGSLAVMRDGGFVALTTIQSRHTSETSLTAFDADGKQRWRVGNDSQDEEKLFSPEDIAVVTSGEIIVLDNIRRVLQIYAADGRYLRTIELQAAWGRRPNYPSGIESDAAGEVIIHDFNGEPPFVRMALDGKVSTQFRPVFPDGRRFDIRGNVQAAPDGNLWTSDGQALLRLDKDGKVDFIVGRKPDVAQLSSIAGIAITADGRIHAADERTGAVHVFDAHGERLHVCRPGPGDYKGKLRLASLSVSDTGDVFVNRNDWTSNGAPDFLRYSAKGERVGIESVKLDEVAQLWFAQPGSTRRWIIGHVNAYLVDAAGMVLRKLDRTAQRQWLVDPGPASVAPDGSVAIVSDGEEAIGSDHLGPRVVTIYSARGDALDTWSVPQGVSPYRDNIAFDGARLVFLTGQGNSEPGNSVVVTDIKGRPLFRFTPPDRRELDRAFFVDAGNGSELWLFDGISTINRYAMP